MKKAFALILLLALLLSGCSHTADSTEPTDSNIIPSADATESESNEFTNEAPSSMPMVSVSVPVLTEEITADDNTVIFRSIQQNMRLVMPDPDVADRIIVDFLNRIDQIAAENSEIRQQAQAAYTGNANWTAYLNSISYDPKRVDQSVLSLYGSSVRFSGGAHAEQASHAANYNVVTGDVLTLGSIIVDASSVAKLSDLVIAELNDVADEKYLRDGFEDTVRQRFDVEESYDEEWYFTTTGLCFYFDPYAIAPYSSGVITVEIPYSELVGIIDDAFFPPEQEAATGAIQTSPAEQADVTQFRRISEVVLQPEAPIYVISTDSSVHNLRIVLTDAVLHREYVIFAAQSLSNGDAVMIQADTNMFRQLNIIYESNGQTITTPLFTE